ncbi:hypothetical protein NW759_002116 [Fusarium solani]|nr:hypothetical protein NW759_002116 [Fusarium solani]
MRERAGTSWKSFGIPDGNLQQISEAIMDSLVKTNPKEDAGAYIEENLELVRKMVEEREELDIPEKVQRAKFLTLSPVAICGSGENHPRRTPPCGDTQTFDGFSYYI